RMIKATHTPEAPWYIVPADEAASLSLHVSRSAIVYARSTPRFGSSCSRRSFHRLQPLCRLGPYRFLVRRGLLDVSCERNQGYAVGSTPWVSASVPRQNARDEAFHDRRPFQCNPGSSAIVSREWADELQRFAL